MMRAMVTRRIVRMLSSTDEEVALGLANAKRLREANSKSVTPAHVAVAPDGLTPGLPANPTEITTLNGQPALHRERTVLIGQKAQSAMTSASHKSKAWVIQWKTEERWSNPLMGWTSTADPLSNLQMQFETAEDAIRFAEKNGWAYDLKEPIPRDKVYGQNKYSHNFLSKAYENETKALGLKVKIWDRPQANASHYFRPLTYHGDKECRQHGLQQDKPWK